MTNPCIIVLDLDGTIVGDVLFQVLIYELSKIKELNIKFNRKQFIQKLKKEIVRYGFRTFIKNLHNTEFFIYTASENKWANYIIKCIEDALGIKFNRPIFSRDYCIIDVDNNIIRKDIEKIKHKICTTLEKKYKHLNTILPNLMIIDNTYDIYDDKSKSILIKCPTYNYKLLENLPIHIDEKIYNNHSNLINEYLNKYFNLNIDGNDYLEFQKKFYSFYIRYIDHIKKKNIKDTFFIDILKIIKRKNIKEFNVKSISYIRNKLINNNQS